MRLGRTTVTFLLAGTCVLSACNDVDIFIVQGTPPPTEAGTPLPPPTNTPVVATSTPLPPSPTPTATQTGPTQTPGEGTATPTATGTPGPPLGSFDCRLNSAASRITINFALGNLPIFNLSGHLATDCGAVDPVTGRASCVSRVASFDPINVPNIGLVCITPVEGCPDGPAACEGGPNVDVNLNQHHNIGTCDGNPSCRTACEARCAGMGMEFFDSGCEGFCEEGPNADGPCQFDTDCPGGSCVGGEPVVHLHACQCQCLGGGETPSSPGAFLMRVGARLEVEPGLPCGDGDAFIILPPICIPLTTEQASGVLLQANNLDQQFGPFGDSGGRLTCEDLAANSVTGMNLVGHISFFDSTLGDLEIALDWVCQ